MSPTAGAFEAKEGNLAGYIRGRVLPGLPITQDFESANLTEMTTNTIEPPTKFAYPPLPWIGARFKFDVRDVNGNKCLVKTIDNPFFQRATVFMGTPDLKNYTIEANVMSDGNKRKMSTVGIINQRYRVVLKGNEQVLETTSNEELLRSQKPFHWEANVCILESAGGPGVRRFGRDPRQGLEEKRAGAASLDERSGRGPRQHLRLPRFIRILSPKHADLY